MVFEINWHKILLEVQQIKWSVTTGRLLGRKQFHLLLFGYNVDERYMEPLGVSSIRTYGRKTVSRLLPGNGEEATVDLIYDYAKDKLSVRRNELRPDFDDDCTCCAFMIPNIISTTDATARSCSRSSRSAASKPMSSVHGTWIPERLMSFRVCGSRFLNMGAETIFVFSMLDLLCSYPLATVRFLAWLAMTGFRSGYSILNSSLISRMRSLFF